MVFVTVLEITAPNAFVTVHNPLVQVRRNYGKQSPGLQSRVTGRALFREAFGADVFAVVLLRGVFTVTAGRLASANRAFRLSRGTA